MRARASSIRLPCTHVLYIHADFRRCLRQSALSRFRMYVNRPILIMRTFDYPRVHTIAQARSSESFLIPRRVTCDFFLLYFFRTRRALHLRLAGSWAFDARSRTIYLTTRVRQRRTIRSIYAFVLLFVVCFLFCRDFCFCSGTCALEC